MAKTNTEKPTGKAESKKQSVETPKKQKTDLNKIPVQGKEEKKLEEVKKETAKETKEEEKPKKPIQKKPKVKKYEATVAGENLPISTKYSASICRFIKNKKIENAISDLEDVLKQKKFVPMKGEYAHKKGKGKIASGAGKFPIKATEVFIKLLKSLQANSNYNEIENPVITEAVSNIGERPYGKFGTVRRKRTHVKITAKEKKMINKKSKTKNKEKRK